eukprot:COSAG05_NODE_16832_length_337_cov_1.470588_2_plen_25_part_01
MIAGQRAEPNRKEWLGGCLLRSDGR